MLFRKLVNSTLWQNTRHFFSQKIKNRKMIQPEYFTQQVFDDNHILVKSEMFQFVVMNEKKIPYDQLYQHEVGTPSGVLRKPAIHLINHHRVPEMNRREKYKSIQRKFEQMYEKSYKKCKTPLQKFHMERHVKGQIRRSLKYIGFIDPNQKYKHYLKFKSIQEATQQKTLQQYTKKGVLVDTINERIFPHGEVWMPTNQNYLKDFQEIVTGYELNDQTNVLDIGSGSGVLSFLTWKKGKKANYIGIDKNPDAVKTFNLNATTLGIKNSQCIQFDTSKYASFPVIAKDNNLPTQYDLIILNPPWIVASNLGGQSKIGQGVYDNKGKMLETSFKLAKSSLKKKGKLVVIYSDLSQIIGLKKNNIEELCRQNDLIIRNKKERAYSDGEMPRKSALSQQKAIAKILTYEIYHSNYQT